MDFESAGLGATQERKQDALGGHQGKWRPQSADEQSRTVELVWSTGARCERSDFWTGKRYVERLVVSDEAMTSRRLRAGAALLDSHDRMSVSKPSSEWSRMRGSVAERSRPMCGLQVTPIPTHLSQSG